LQRCQVWQAAGVAARLGCLILLAWGSVEAS
jgi:hypothetical protein